MASIETAEWSGEGTFSLSLVDALRSIDDVGLLRVADAQAPRLDVGYQYIGNEIYVGLRTQAVQTRIRRFGFWPTTVVVDKNCMSLTDLGRLLSESPAVGEADYIDDGMMQYLRTERIIPPYQTRGYKLVELVRIYAV